MPTVGDANTKLMRGLLEPFLLEILSREPKHGYALLGELGQVFGAPPNRNQVYPLLNRLEHEGYLRADRSGGRGRTRYGLTRQGVELLRDYQVRTPLFHERAAALWPGLPEGASPARPLPPARTTPEATSEQNELTEPPTRVAAGTPRGEPRTGPAGPTCRADVAFRRRPTGDVSVEVGNLDPGCPDCQELATTLRGLRDRWLPL